MVGGWTDLQRMARSIWTWSSLHRFPSLFIEKQHAQLSLAMPLDESESLWDVELWGGERGGARGMEEERQGMRENVWLKTSPEGTCSSSTWRDNWNTTVVQFSSTVWRAARPDGSHLCLRNSRKCFETERVMCCYLTPWGNKQGIESGSTSLL